MGKCSLLGSGNEFEAGRVMNYLVNHAGSDCTGPDNNA